MKKISNKIEFCEKNIKNIKEKCKTECNFILEKKILHSIFIPEIADHIFTFLEKNKCLNNSHQIELYENNLLLEIYKKRLKSCNIR